jgi:hypothetical protein
MVVAATALHLLQRGGGNFTGPFWARLGLGWPGVLLLLRPVCYCLWRWRLFPPTWLWFCRPLSSAVSSVRPASQRLPW